MIPNERLERARAAAGTVEGWLTPVEGELLFSLGSACPAAGTIVEIGSWKGKSTTWLAMGAARPGIRIVAVDPHEPYLLDPRADSLADFTANMDRLGLSSIVTPLVSRSAPAAASFETPIDVLFIDGDHEEASVAEDLALWLPKLKIGGFVAMHDVRNRQWPGVSRCLSRVLWGSTIFSGVSLADSIVVMERVARNTLAERCRTSVFAVGLRMYSRLPRQPLPLPSEDRKS